MQDNFVKKMEDFEVLLGYYTSRLICHPLTPPEHVYFSLTNRCNLRCKMCEVYRDSTAEESEISTGKIKEVIIQIRDMGINHIIFSGGEPLLRKDLVEIVSFAHANNIKMVDLITNATMLDNKIMGELIEAGLNHIGISIDGLSQTSSRIRGPGVFEKVIKNINNLNIRKNNSGNNLPSVGVNFTIMGENIHDMLPLVNLARDMQCLFVSFQPVLFNNTKMFINRKNTLWPSAEKIKELQGVVRELLRLKREAGGVNIFTDADVLNSLPDYFLGRRPQADFRCYEAIKRIVITCEGQLWSCQGILGDLNKNTLSQIWYSEKTKKARQDIKKCKRHCLQDCVYFPSDILKIAKNITQPNFLSLSSWKDVTRQRLVNKIDAYIKILSENKNTEGNIFMKISHRYAIKVACNKLKMAKRCFLNKYTPVYQSAGTL
jgi:MoaA/NifB/PqqE/SkfB family radical SAM enzyme